MNQTLPQDAKPSVPVEDTDLPAAGGLPAEARAYAQHDSRPWHEFDNNPRYCVIPGFHSNYLANDRSIRVHLPEAYLAEPDRRFPVFYLHDGQNLFDGRTSYVFNRTWRAHATADWLASTGAIEPVILVGIDNTGLHRMAEYTPTRDFRLGGGDGEQYGKLLTEELKPYIDAHFRTLPGCTDTGLGGSSLGGLISLALGLHYPEVFCKLAVLSPSVWWDHRSVLSLVNEARPKPNLRIWLDMGTSEGLRHLRDCDLLHHRLKQRGWRDGKDLRYIRVPGGLHNEDAWAARFAKVLEFLFPVRNPSGTADR